MSLFDPLRRLLRVATRTVESSPGYAVLPYSGYGSREEIYVVGAVFHQRSGDPSSGLLAQIGRRLLRTGVPGVDVNVTLYGSSTRVTTDEDGYFETALRLKEEPPSDRLWHELQVELAEPLPDEQIARKSAVARVFIPRPDARFVVVSDIDDTVMYTGVANKIKMFWRLFAQDAESRVAFPGVAALYRALYEGPSRGDHNPILYVSRGHWGLYDMLEEFFHAHEIPIGPILFLREWGITLKSPFPRRAEDHKAHLIRRMIALYDDLPFVLIGDSGQHDPELYADVVRRHGDRVQAIYIRDVSHSSSRNGEIEALAKEVTEAGSTLMLADDSYAMARHAADHGLISEACLAGVLDERVREGEPQPDRTTGPLVVEP